MALKIWRTNPGLSLERKVDVRASIQRLRTGRDVKKAEFFNCVNTLKGNKRVAAVSTPHRAGRRSQSGRPPVPAPAADEGVLVLSQPTPSTSAGRTEHDVAGL